MNMQKNNDPMVVELYAQQFNWKARYAGTDNVLGKSNVRFIDIDKANILGLDENDPNAADDVITTELHLPVDRPSSICYEITGCNSLCLYATF